MSRSSGPGGQHANTAETRVEAVFDVDASGALTDRQKQRVRAAVGPVVRAVAQDERSQARNRELAVERLVGKLRDALRVERRRVATRPTFGARTLLRRFANLSRRVPLPVACRVVRLNAEPAVLVTLPTAGDGVFASVHVETRGGRVVAMRVVRDPAKLAPLQEVMQ